MRHIHPSIVSRHLATRDSDKILHTPPPHSSSSEEILPSLTCHTLAQLSINNPSSNHTYIKSMPNHIHHHYSPSETHHLFNSIHICTMLSPLDLWTNPDGTERWLLDNKWEDWTPPKARVSTHQMLAMCILCVDSLGFKNINFKLFQ